MALVLNNAQSELWEIEIGRHALGALAGGMSNLEYCRRSGHNANTLKDWVSAARVFVHVHESWSGSFSGTSTG